MRMQIEELFTLRREPSCSWHAYTDKFKEQQAQSVKLSQKIVKPIYFVIHYEEMATPR